jgi:D-serine deaminase-like pyridoxal phosphate-dependent protein
MSEQQLLINDVETPAILVYLDILDSNLRTTAELAREANVKLRPHFKTHKSVWIAQKQMEYGASGVTVAKLGEAEMLLEAGITDILVAFPIVGQAKLKRLSVLMEKADIIASTDSMEVAEGLSHLGNSLGRTIPLYVDVNTGLNRCGKEAGEESAALVVEIAALPGVEVRGLMTHGGHAYGKTTSSGLREVARLEAEGLVKTKELLERAGISIPEISVGSTPTSKYIAEQTGVTEMRPGAYVYGDGGQLSTGIIDADEVAMRVLATVVSLPRKGTAIIDAGSKTFSCDPNAHRPGYGICEDNPEIYVSRLSEEHGILHVPDGVNLSIGDRLSFIPNHCCTVANLHNQLYGVRDGIVEQQIIVDARGKIV